MSDQRLDETISALRASRLKVTRYDRPHAWAWAVFGLGVLSAVLFVVLLWYHVVQVREVTERTWAGGSAVVSSSEGASCELRTPDGTRSVSVPGYYQVPRYVRVDPGPAGPATLSCNYPVSAAQGPPAWLYRMYGNDLTGLAVTAGLIMFGGHFGPANAYRMRQRRLGRWRSRPSVVEQTLIREREQRRRR
jgi:hypothetical protein